MGILRPFVLSTLAVSLAACATTSPPSQPGLSGIDRQVVDARGDLADRQRRSELSFERVDEVWLGAVPVQRTAAEPAVFSRPAEFMRFYPVTLNEVANYIAQTFDLQVTVTEDAVEAMYAANGQAGQGRVGGSVPSMGGVGAVPPPVPGQIGGATHMPSASVLGSLNGSGGGGMTISYAGTLRGLLDTVAAQSGTSWRHVDGRVEIYALETRVFQVSVLPGSTSMDASITNRSTGGNRQSGGGGGGGGQEGAQTQMTGGADTNMSIALDPFEDVIEAIKGLATERGVVTATPAMAQVVVTDRPVALARIGEYIEQVNKLATRQVVLDVRVYVVEANRSNGHAISWDAVWSSVSRQIGVDLNAGNSITGGSRMGMSILDAGSPWNGTRLVLDALATQGNVRELTSASVVTLSGRPVPVQVAEEVGYLESTQVSLVPDVGQQVTLTPGKVTSGFSMNLLPIMSGKDTILMQAMINLSSLRELRRLGSDSQGNTMETPLIDSRQTMQNVRLESGQTLVLTGFEQETLRSNASGVGSPGFRLLGGAKDEDKRSTSLVIMITPKVVS